MKKLDSVLPPCPAAHNVASHILSLSGTPELLPPSLAFARWGNGRRYRPGLRRRTIHHGRSSPGPTELERRENKGEGG